MSQKIITFYRIVLAFTIMGITGTIGLILRVFSGGLLLNFNRKYLIANSSRIILRLIGIRLVIPSPNDFTGKNIFYTFNHNSYLDTLILTSLGITNMRPLLSVKTYKFIPMTIAAFSIGTLYIPLQEQKEKRMRFFVKLEKRIRREKFSVFASSEGVHDFFHGIAPFNNGVYHMATACRMDIVPIYFHIPEETNPFKGFSYHSGTIRIEVLDRISVADWRLEELEENKNRVRTIFVEKFNQSHNRKRFYEYN